MWHRATQLRKLPAESHMLIQTKSKRLLQTLSAHYGILKSLDVRGTAFVKHDSEDIYHLPLPTLLSR